MHFHQNINKSNSRSEVLNPYHSYVSHCQYIFVIVGRENILFSIALQLNLKQNETPLFAQKDGESNVDSCFILVFDSISDQ